MASCRPPGTRVRGDVADCALQALAIEVVDDAFCHAAPLVERERHTRPKSYITHHITNAVTEGLNAKIQWIKYTSRGFRDRERFKLAIYFHCGGLDLDPRV